MQAKFCAVSVNSCVILQIHTFVGAFLTISEQCREFDDFCLVNELFLGGDLRIFLGKCILAQTLVL